MISQLLDFIQEIFPNIDPYTREKAKDALKAYERLGCEGAFTETGCREEMLQGDIYNDVPFIQVAPDGSIQPIKSKAMILSNTCDCVRNDNLLFAAILPIQDVVEGENKVREAKLNRFFQFFYVPDRRVEEDIVDFGLVNSVPRVVFNERVAQGKSRKIVSLSFVGYCIFIAKLAVFLMRPEDVETNQSRENPPGTLSKS